eukprot:CAMPEP_0194045580 /NCGR_PEP_ID=MMETSP0009_2-20130614/16872_1 /TAXON_ID=210454 /ORGANISM="Grammatophora oceanica, Strain CCMP 410" /LENGTH=213 /DNA_ID=CAMNT_0038690461 /DNA_START=117 /DNA_END=758 /DNA_ORIENTATION=+
MGGTSSKPKPKPRPAVSEIDRAVLDLKVSRDKLQKYKKQLEVDGAKLLIRAKQAKAEGRTSTALGLLRLRHHKEREAQSVENQLLTVLQMVETIGSKQNEKEVLAAMKSGKNALSKLHEETTVEDVLDLMDQIQEQNEVEEEISTILSGVPSLSAADEASVEAELEALIAAQAGTTKLPEAPTTQLPDVLPQVPTNKPAEATQTEEARVAVAS